MEKSNSYSADLKKLAADTLNETELYATKADAMFARATDFTDLDMANINQVTGWLKNIKWLTTWSPESVKLGAFFPLACSISGIILCIIVAKMKMSGEPV